MPISPRSCLDNLLSTESAQNELQMLSLLLISFYCGNGSPALRSTVEAVRHLGTLQIAWKRKPHVAVLGNPPFCSIEALLYAYIFGSSSTTR